MRSVAVQLLPEDTHQTVDGFGANINAAGQWRNGALKPVIDLLVDHLGARLFRLDPFGNMDWPDEPGAFKAPVFREAWGLARYLNEKGAEVLLNVSGTVPASMCGDDGQTLEDVETYADLVTSLAAWARHEEGIEFRYVGPLNETDLGPPEGPFADASVATRTLEALADRLDAAGLGDVRFAALDQAFYGLDYLAALASSSKLRERVGVAAMHCYGDYSLDPVRAFIASEELQWRYWLTEFGDLDQSGEREWEVATACVRRLLRGLADGVQAATIWDAYDNWHLHDRSWTIYGLLRTGNNLYTPKKRYHALRHVYRFAPPGSVRLGLAADGAALPLVAFRSPDRHLTIVGLNESAEPVELALDPGTNDHPGDALILFGTDPSRDCARLAEIAFTGGAPRFEIPAQCVFTVSSMDVQPEGVSVSVGPRAPIRERP